MEVDERTRTWSYISLFFRPRKLRSPILKPERPVDAKWARTTLRKLRYDYLYLLERADWRPNRTLSEVGDLYGLILARLLESARLPRRNRHFDGLVTEVKLHCLVALQMIRDAESAA